MRLDAKLGATPLGDGRCQFLVWAPRARRVEVRLVAPRQRLVAMEPLERGYHHAVLDGVAPGARYLYRLHPHPPAPDAAPPPPIERPDPASRLQPLGVHGPSEVVDPAAFHWTDRGWRGLPLREYVTYELHVGVFTPEGTFEAIVPRLDALRDLGITAVELMPVAQFPGRRNWGYDGVYPFAVQDSYGGPAGLQRLVDACHARGLALVLDVVYNHLGPEGNYLAEYGPYFTDRYRTPWGAAVNFDGPHSDEVRRYFTENALRWFEEFHLDALRLDAIHAIRDFSAHPFLEELGLATRELAERLGRRLYLVAESDLNDARVICPRALGGLGLDAQWSDDFHHALHTLLTAEREGYYQDFGRVEHLAAAYRQGYVYAGQYSAYRRRRHGSSPRLVEPHQLVVCAQNHDQVGNRAAGERLSQLVSFDRLKLAAGALLLSPFLPLLFMGEEYAELAPFQYFTSHTDPALGEAVRHGRRQEFAAFGWADLVPDPQDEATFLRCKLHWQLREQGHHAALLALYRELLRLRRELPALARPSAERLEALAFEPERALVLRRWCDEAQAFAVFNFGQAEACLRARVPPGPWCKLLDSADPRWLGPGGGPPERLESDGAPRLRLPAASFALYVQT